MLFVMVISRKKFKYVCHTSFLFLPKITFVGCNVPFIVLSKHQGHGLPNFIKRFKRNTNKASITPPRSFDALLGITILMVYVDRSISFSSPVYKVDWILKLTIIVNYFNSQPIATINQFLYFPLSTSSSPSHFKPTVTLNCYKGSTVTVFFIYFF